MFRNHMKLSNTRRVWRQRMPYWKSFQNMAVCLNCVIFNVVMWLYLRIIIFGFSYLVLLHAFIWFSLWNELIVAQYEMSIKSINDLLKLVWFTFFQRVEKTSHILGVVFQFTFDFDKNLMLLRCATNVKGNNIPHCRYTNTICCSFRRDHCT